MGLLIALLVAALIFFCAFALVDMMPVDGRGKQILKIILVLIALVWLLQNFVHPWGGWYLR